MVERNWAEGRLKAPVLGSRTSVMLLWSVGGWTMVVDGDVEC
jgi:hypothetical protein